MVVLWNTQFTVAIVLQNQCGTILQNHKVFQSVFYNFINYNNMLTSKARQGKYRKKNNPSSNNSTIYVDDIISCKAIQAETEDWADSLFKYFAVLEKKLTWTVMAKHILLQYLIIIFINQYYRTKSCDCEWYLNAGPNVYRPSQYDRVSVLVTKTSLVWRMTYCCQHQIQIAL